MICLAGIISKMFIQIIGKEKYLQDTKHNEEFYQNNYPEGFAHCHVFKTFGIKRINIFLKPNPLHKYYFLTKITICSDFQVIQRLFLSMIYCIHQ
jgi:hypothetical protein